MRWLWLLVVASACGRVNFDPLTDGGGSGSSGGDGGSGSGSDGGTTGTACQAANPACVATAGSLNLSGSYNASNNTASLGNGLSGSCGGGSSNEFTVQLIATAAGTYEFSTANSQIDTVLYIKDTCNGSELACSNVPGGTEIVTLPLTLNQSIIVVVDGASACGVFQLRARAI